MKSLAVALLISMLGMPSTDVAGSRARHIQRGINLSHWFAQSPGGDYSKAHLDTFTTERDVELIARMGFDHARLTVEPAPMFQPDSPEKLSAEYLGYVDGAIAMLLAHGLAVIVDVHPSEEFKERLNTDAAHVDTFVRFWGAFAKHLSKYDPERVFLEGINEPTVTDARRWTEIQARLVRTIREAAPRHTIIVTGANYSNPDDLLQMETVADKNVIYNFHFYTPHTYTHQGATWGSPDWKFLTSVPYPSTPEAVAPRLSAVTDDRARATLEHYGKERWNAARVESEIAKLAEWGRARGVVLTCNEFGVYRKYSVPAERAAWLGDVRTSLERHRIGWAMWDYRGGFSVVNREDGAATPDAATLQALGLTVKPAAPKAKVGR